MLKRLLGPILLLVVSVVLGLAAGNVFFKLCLEVVPPALLTNFNKTTAHGAFLSYGLVLGLVIFLWVLAAVALNRVFGRRRGRESEDKAREGTRQ